jgi:hypothetical protein
MLMSGLLRHLSGLLKEWLQNLQDDLQAGMAFDIM